MMETNQLGGGFLILIDVIGASAIIRSQSVLTSGMVGAEVEFRFDEVWDGLYKTAVFRSVNQSFDVIVSDTSVEIPSEVLQTYGVPLEIGVYGVSESGEIIIPTVWVKTNLIKQGADPYADTNANPALPIWVQLQMQINGITNIPAPSEEDEGDFLQISGAKWVPAPLQTDSTIKYEKRILSVNVTHTVENGNLFPVSSEAVEKEFSLVRNDLVGIVKDIADLKYVPIVITKVTNNVGTVEIGTVVNTVTVSWSLNKLPSKQTLGSTELSVDARSATLSDMNLTGDKTFSLVVTDERGATDSATTSISFLNGVYYGVLESGATIDSAAILALTRKLQGSKGITFTADAGATQQIVYALPTRYGVPGFNVGGFDGGFAKATTFDFTNASGYTESYDVWLSENVGLGSTTVKVS